MTVSSAVLCLTTDVVLLHNPIPHNEHDRASHFWSKQNEQKKNIFFFLTEQLLRLRAVEFHF